MIAPTLCSSCGLRVASRWLRPLEVDPGEAPRLRLGAPACGVCAARAVAGGRGVAYAADAREALADLDRMRQAGARQARQDGAGGAGRRGRADGQRRAVDAV